jgi:hypothetical protein
MESLLRKLKPPPVRAGKYAVVVCREQQKNRKSDVQTKKVVVRGNLAGFQPGEVSSAPMFIGAINARELPDCQSSMVKRRSGIPEGAMHLWWRFECKSATIWWLGVLTFPWNLHPLTVSCCLGSASLL